MTPCERIKRTLNFKIPDRVGIYDNLRGYFPEFDFALFDPDKFDKSEYRKAKNKNLFLTFSFSCPFQKAVETLGLENALLMIAQDPKGAERIFADNTERIIGEAEKLKVSGFIFDGAWMWSDLAYKNSTYFSADTYKKLLYKYHAKLCRYFKRNAMPVILHSDGNCVNFIPLFLAAGARALNPLEISCGFKDAKFLKKEYGKDMVLFGNMPAVVLEKGKKEIEKVFKKRLQILKAGGGFIYHSDKPIPPSVNFENYAFALEIIRKYGSYK